MKSWAGLLFLVVVPMQVWPQTAGPIRPNPEKEHTAKAGAREGFVEVTKKDFTKLEVIRATQLTTFGIALGDTAEDADRKASGAGLLKKTSANGGRESWYRPDGKETLAWKSADGRVTEVFWYEGMKDYLHGESARLFNDRIAHSDDPTRLELLGREDRRTVEPIASVGVMVTCSYDQEGLRVSQFQQSTLNWGVPVIRLVQTAKRRGSP